MLSFYHSRPHKLALGPQSPEPKAPATQPAPWAHDTHCSSGPGLHSSATAWVCRLIPRAQLSGCLLQEACPDASDHAEILSSASEPCPHWPRVRSLPRQSQEAPALQGVDDIPQRALTVSRRTTKGGLGAVASPPTLLSPEQPLFCFISCWSFS